MSVQSVNQRVQELHHVRNLQANYDKTLLVLKALKDGELTLDDIAVTNDGWKLVVPPQQPLSVVLEDEDGSDFELIPEGEA